MPQSVHELDIDRLSISERIDLIARLWDSIPDSVEALPFPDSHREELERRLQAADAAPERAIPWDEVRARLRGNR